MSKLEKLKNKLNSKPKSSTYYSELRTLLTGLGYEEMQGGKTSGSRAAFIHKDTHHIIRLYKPHPGNELRRYQIEEIRGELAARGVFT